MVPFRRCRLLMHWSVHLFARVCVFSVHSISFAPSKVTGEGGEATAP